MRGFHCFGSLTRMQVNMLPMIAVTLIIVAGYSPAASAQTQSQARDQSQTQRQATSRPATDPAARPAIIYGACRIEHIEAMIEAAMLSEEHAAVCREAFAIYLMALDELRHAGGVELFEAGELEYHRLQLTLMPPNDAALLFPGMGETNRAAADDPRWFRLQELEAARHNIMREVTRKHLALLRTLIASLQLTLDESAYTIFTALRFLLVEWSAAGDDVRLRNQSPMHVDVASLARQSMIDGVLHDVFQQFASREEGRTDEAALRLAINDILRQYYQALEPKLARQKFALPDIQKAEDIVFSRSYSDEDMDDVLARSGRNWAARHDKDVAAAEQVAFAVAERADETHAASWRRSFQAAVAPHLFQAWPAHGVADWFDQQDDASDELRAIVHVLQDEHNERYERAAQQCYRALLTLGRESGSVITSGTDRRTHERYNSALLRLHEISIETIQRMQTSMTTEQSARLSRWLPAFPFEHGPMVQFGFLRDETHAKRLQRVREVWKQYEQQGIE